MNIFSIKNLAILLSSFIIFFSSCKKDDPEPGNVSITTVATAEGSRGESVDINLTLTADAGIQTLTVSVDGGTDENLSVTAGSTTEDVTYSFEIPANTTLNTAFSLLFSLTDAEGVNEETTVTLTTGAVISTPSTYAFERNGATTVSYSGQTERLNMVAEIKSKVLAEGDNGNVISEQVLLDAYENAGENGGGLFTFTSTKQLKDKTFQPDLDANLFENLFADAAAASVAANGGQMASNGKSGLITREDKGSTILVDANGREFTQLIEKGLMGSVFFNQIYNVYLTDARTGDDVENVDLADGKNYTDMEHHWDEAYGYFDAPVDFVSAWPEDRNGELRFWSNYSNTVDNVNNDLLGTNDLIMEAFLNGRTAIVNQDWETKNASKDALYENLDLVAAATAVHYINSTLKYLNESKTGEAFHTLSEAWAFVNALRYNPNRKMDLADIEVIMNTDFGENGNFWNVTPAGLNKAKSSLVTAYPDMETIKDDL